MSGNMLAQYLKERLLKTKQILVHVSNLLKKLAIGDKTKPLGSQSVGPKSEQLRVIWLGHLLVFSRRGSANLNMCYCI